FLRGDLPVPAHQRAGQEVADPPGEEVRQGPRPGGVGGAARPRRLSSAPQTGGLRRPAVLCLVGVPTATVRGPLEDSAAAHRRGERTPDRAGELVAELGPTRGERPGRGSVVGQRALLPALTPMPRTPAAGIGPRHAFRWLEISGGRCGPIAVWLPA